MRVALVASSYAPGRGEIGRHVDRLATGLARRGVDVEIFGQDGVHGTERLLDGDGVLVRRSALEEQPLRFAVAPHLWKALRFARDAFDVVDVHTTRIPMSLAVAHIGCRRLVLTPHAPLRRLMAWPYTGAIRTLVQAADSILCPSDAERDLLCRTFPSAAGRSEVRPAGVDAPAIAAAAPYAVRGKVLVSAGPLDRHRGTDRAIAAIASLDPPFRLVVVGDGPDQHRLLAYAADLQVASRVALTGPVPEAIRYRWLRTASVVTVLAEEESTGVRLMEAIAAGACVVASDIPVHREVAQQIDGAKVIFVSVGGSPLEVADAIAEAAALSEIAPPLPSPVPTWESVVDYAWSVYRNLVVGTPALGPAHHDVRVTSVVERS